MATFEPDSKSQPPSKPAFFARLSILYAITAVLLLTLTAFIWHSLNRLVAENDWVTHTYEVMERTEAVISRLRSIQADAWCSMFAWLVIAASAPARARRTARWQARARRH